MKFPIFEVVFFVFSATLIAAATMVVVSRNPVRSSLFLVLAFFASSVLWITLQAEFLALVLIFVYVGAVMTLFLFVVMMLDIDRAVIQEGFVKYLPVCILLLAFFIGLMIYVIGVGQPGLTNALLPRFPASYSNVSAMGQLLYTHYLYEFEVAGALLLVAIIAAIALAFHGRKAGTKSQVITEQLRANKKNRLRIVPMKSEGESS